MTTTICETKMDTLNFLEELQDDTIPLDKIAEYVPAMLHVNNISDFKPIYIDPISQKHLGIDLQNDDFHVEDGLQLVHPDDLAFAIKVNQHYLSNMNEYKTISFTQRIYLRHKKEYAAYYTTSMFIEKRGGIVSLSVPLGDMSFNEKSIDHILDDISFVRKHVKHFSELTKREKEVIFFWVQQYNNKEIASKLSISTNTVKTYKKQIYRKLDINQFHQLYRYARSFDLI